MPRRLTWALTPAGGLAPSCSADADADIDDGVGRASRRHGHAEPLAFTDARGNAKFDFVKSMNRAEAAARIAPFLPRLAASAAVGTGRAYGNVERDGGAEKRF